MRQDGSQRYLLAKFRLLTATDGQATALFDRGAGARALIWCPFHALQAEMR